MEHLQWATTEEAGHGRRGGLLRLGSGCLAVPGRLRECQDVRHSRLQCAQGVRRDRQERRLPAGLLRGRVRHPGQQDLHLQPHGRHPLLQLPDPGADRLTRLQVPVGTGQGPPQQIRLRVAVLPLHPTHHPHPQHQPVIGIQILADRQWRQYLAGKHCLQSVLRV